MSGEVRVPKLLLTSGIIYHVSDAVFMAPEAGVAFKRSEAKFDAMCLSSAQIAQHAQHAKQLVVERWTYGTATCSF